MGNTNKIINPIIPGFYPDPSICRVGEDFYLVCSSFELCPGIPVFHSRDLAHWEQICNAMTPENGFHVEKEAMISGVMAPTIRYHEGTFYIINANFCDRGNYIVTAKDPAGPWSEPHWLDDVPGIDASIFFDNDGKAYIMGTGNVWDNGAGEMERGIWLAEYDIREFRMIGEPVTIFNSALRGAASPEAPHLYHIGDYYYLIIAEGGTEHYHSVVVARSRELFGFYEGNPANPVLTHRHMGFHSPIINVGHADLVELPDKSWYAVMLASRLIEGECKNLGRETFLCPVIWERDWPVFAPETGKVEWEYPAAESLPWTETAGKCEREDFSDEALGLDWVFWGTPYERFYELKDGKLSLRCIHQGLVNELRPMCFGADPSKENFAGIIGKRQCQPYSRVTCSMDFVPHEKETAGLAVIQASNHQFHLERALQDGRSVVRCVCCSADFNHPPYFPGFESTTSKRVTAQAEWEDAHIVLQIEMNGEDFRFRYGASEDELIELSAEDGRLINPEKVGCMSGTLLGMYASGNGTDSENKAEFDWFELKEGRVGE